MNSLHMKGLRTVNAELQKWKVAGRPSRAPSTAAQKLMILLIFTMFTVLLAYF